MKLPRIVSVSAIVACAAILGTPAAAQVQMPNAKEMSGKVLPSPDLPAGTVTVRVARGGVGNYLPGQTVEFTVDGKKRTATTDQNGRVEFSNLRPGAPFKAAVTVDGERLESDDAVVGSTGLRIMLVATDPEAAKREAEDAKLAAGPAQKGLVVFGPESRVIAEMAKDRLSIYYDLQIVNSARVPVDIGGPLIIDLPREARGSTVLEGSTPQATANGPRITVVGPFAPGVTSVQAAYELPYSGPTASLTQTWPAAMEQTIVMVQQIGGLTVTSPQLTAKQDINDQGQALIIGRGPGLAAGQSLSVEIAGLPHHPSWPRNLALALAGLIMAAGFWGALGPSGRRPSRSSGRAA
jgi:hypothetical protein